MGLAGENSLYFKRVAGFLLSLVLLLLKPGMVTSAKREWCCPVLKDLLTVLLEMLVLQAVEDANEATNYLLESFFGLCDGLLPQSSRFPEGTWDGERQVSESSALSFA